MHELETGYHSWNSKNYFKWFILLHSAGCVWEAGREPLHPSCAGTTWSFVQRGLWGPESPLISKARAGLGLGPQGKAEAAALCPPVSCRGFQGTHLPIILPLSCFWKLDTPPTISHRNRGQRPRLGYLGISNIWRTEQLLLRLRGLTDTGCHATGPPAPNGKHWITSYSTSREDHAGQNGHHSWC